MRVLLADDESLARLRLRRALEAVAYVDIVGEAETGLEVLDCVEKLQPDLILLDIDMPQLDGLGVASMLCQGNSPCPRIIFVTAFDHHALKAFELAALDYLVKPISNARLYSALQRAHDSSGHSAQMAQRQAVQSMHSNAGPLPFAVRCGGRFVVVDPRRVRAVLAQDHYSTLLVDGSELLSDEPLDVLESRMGGPQWVRVHRGALVNLHFVREIRRDGDRKYVAVLTDAPRTEIAVSRRRLDALKVRLGLIEAPDCPHRP